MYKSASCAARYIVGSADTSKHRNSPRAFHNFFRPPSLQFHSQQVPFECKEKEQHFGEVNSKVFPISQKKFTKQQLAMIFSTSFRGTVGNGGLSRVPRNPAAQNFYSAFFGEEIYLHYRDKCFCLQPQRFGFGEREM